MFVVFFITWNCYGEERAKQHCWLFACVDKKQQGKEHASHVDCMLHWNNTREWNYMWWKALAICWREAQGYLECKSIRAQTDNYCVYGGVIQFPLGSRTPCFRSLKPTSQGMGRTMHGLQCANNTWWRRRGQEGFEWSKPFVLRISRVLK